MATEAEAKEGLLEGGEAKLGRDLGRGGAGGVQSFRSFTARYLTQVEEHMCRVIVES